MGSLILQRSFEAPREKRELPAEYSLDRQPWRAFRSSLAVQFTSRRPGGWAADQLSDQAKAEIISGLEARSVIISSYSRIQSSVRDLAAKAGFSAPHGKGCGAYIAPSQEVLRYAKSLTAEGGPLSGGRQALENLFGRIEVTSKAGDLFVQGFVEVREEASGAILFRFKQWNRRQSFTSKDLMAKALAIELLARDAEMHLATALALV